jgi:hypothetical protein
MIVDRCDRPSFYTKSLTESIKNPTEVKDGFGCKVQQHYLHKHFFLNVDNFHDNINSKVELNMWYIYCITITEDLRSSPISGGFLSVNLYFVCIVFCRSMFFRFLLPLYRLLLDYKDKTM